MAIKVYWISGLEPGRLGIMPRPLGGAALEGELRSLKESEVDAVVCLLEPQEIAELNLAEEQSRCEAQGILYLSFPIGDFSVPRSKRETHVLARRLANFVQAGKTVVIHCRGGIGRSSLLASCVLSQLGVSIDDAFELIGSARGIKVPETEEQQAWVAEFAENQTD